MMRSHLRLVLSPITGQFERVYPIGDSRAEFPLRAVSRLATLSLGGYQGSETFTTVRP